MPSVKELSSIGYKSLESKTEKELVALINQTVSVANRRLTTLRKAGLADMASAVSFRAPKGGKGRFETISANTKLSKQALKHKFIQVRNFVRDPTSTVKGARKELRDVVRAVSESGQGVTEPKGGYRYNRDGEVIGYGKRQDKKHGGYKNRVKGHENERGYTKHQTIRFWQIFRKLKSELGIPSGDVDSNRMLDVLSDMVLGDRSYEDLSEEATARFNGVYEEYQKKKKQEEEEILRSAGADLDME